MFKNKNLLKIFEIINKNTFKEKRLKGNPSPEINIEKEGRRQLKNQRMKKDPKIKSKNQKKEGRPQARSSSKKRTTPTGSENNVKKNKEDDS